MQASARSYGLDICIVRSVNVYGPGQFPEKLIPLAVSTVLGGGKIALYGDRVEQFTREDSFTQGVVINEDGVGPGAQVFNMGLSAPAIRRYLRKLGKIADKAESLGSMTTMRRWPPACCRPRSAKARICDTGETQDSSSPVPKQST